MSRAADRTWAALIAEAEADLVRAGIAPAGPEARRIVGRASGYEVAELALHRDERPTAVATGSCRRMVERRCAGEPLQYVLGGWGFRTLDLLVDRRVLIPRPETETVVDHALGAIDDAVRRGVRSPLAVDLGTGSGAIALSLVAERPTVEVWATDLAADALTVARANLAGTGRVAARVRLAEGDWFGALPAELTGSIDVIVANPPYVADADPLPDEVARWEPVAALRAGPEGLDAIAVVLGDAGRWLAPGGTIVVEIGETQGAAARRLASVAGLVDEVVHPDLLGRDRVLVARRRTEAPTR